MSNIKNDSTNNRTSRYVHGGNTEKSEGFLEWWDKKNLPVSNTDIEYNVEKFYEGRLDLIAYAFYDEPRYWWIIAQYNAILDPVAEVVEGLYLRIPKLERVRSEFLTGKTGGTESKRVLNTIIEPFISNK